MWESLCQNFATIGIGTYELIYRRNRALFYEIGFNRYPQFIAIVNGRKIKYKGDMNERGIREFIATILPHNLLEHVSYIYLLLFTQDCLFRLLSMRVLPSLWHAYNGNLCQFAARGLYSPLWPGRGLESLTYSVLTTRLQLKIIFQAFLRIVLSAHWFT